MLQQEEDRRNDGIDLITDGMKEWQEVVDEATGQVSQQLVYNPDIAWYKGHIINQPFGRYALYLEQFKNLAKDAPNKMFHDRAVEIAAGILRHVLTHKRSIDGKSSEIFKDKDNTQSALIHILTRNKVEKQYTLEGDGKKANALAAIFGRQDE